MPVSEYKEHIPVGFDAPTALPRTPEQEREWQEANRSWWESHPMRYDFTERLAAEEFSKEFYEEIDRRFYSDVKTFMPWRQTPFDALMPFDRLGGMDVLEIGVGNGTHARLLAERARSYTGIDLTEYATRSTGRRLQLAGLGAPAVSVRRMDAESMTFEDESFDFIWSWGVIHHSANTRKILEQMRRVLRPGGTATTMVYHRNFWSYQVVAGLFNGILNGRLFKSGSLHRSRQQIIDGAIARYYTIPEWSALVSDLFTVEDVRVYGSKAELLPLPAGKVKDALKAALPDSFCRVLTNNCKMGMFLVTTLKRK